MPRLTADGARLVSIYCSELFTLASNICSEICQPASGEGSKIIGHILMTVYCHMRKWHESVHGHILMAAYCHMNKRHDLRLCSNAWHHGNARFLCSFPCYEAVAKQVISGGVQIALFPNWIECE